MSSQQPPASPVGPVGESPILSALAWISPLRRYGYQVVAHDRAPASFLALRQAFAEEIAERLERFAGVAVGELVLEDYATRLEQLSIDHGSFMRATARELPDSLLHCAHMTRLVELAGEAVGQRLRVYNDVLEYRVCRPHQPDNNPWHRDSWFPGFKPLLNVYLPLSGSWFDSSLQVVPGSHLWSDEECVPSFQFTERHYQAGTTEKEGVRFNVPEVAECRYELRGHRPDIVPGDFMLFATSCVHGSGANASPETRFSFEFRLEIAP